MLTLSGSIDEVRRRQRESGKPLAVVLAGHNGSGKSTMWYRQLAPKLEIPLINADRMMLSILPELGAGEAHAPWAQALRDTNESWMFVAQKGVEAFVARAMTRGVPFAMETVFSHWLEREDGTVESKINLITDMQDAGYFVLLIFVGLRDVGLSIARVLTRSQAGGHDVPDVKLANRFPRTQRAIEQARSIADATLFVDNSRDETKAFTVARVQTMGDEIYDLRNLTKPVPPEILSWMDVVCPQ